MKLLYDENLIKELIIIVAVSENNVIGRDGSIPWYYPEDLKRFKHLTLNHPVIMGRKTYESIHRKLRNPLPNRLNVVLTKKQTLENTDNYENVIVINDILEFFQEVPKLISSYDSIDFKEVWIIGGEEIYNLFLPNVNRLEITKIKNSYNGDTFFPKIDKKLWKIVKEENLPEFVYQRFIKR